MTLSLSELIDLANYPIDQPDSDGYASAVDQARQGLRTDGCAIVRLSLIHI